MSRTINTLAAAFAVLIMGVASQAYAQDTGAVATPVTISQGKDANPADTTIQTSGAQTDTTVVAQDTTKKADPKPAAPTSTFINNRYFELQKFDLQSRYRFVDNSDGVTTNNQLQYGLGIQGRFKIDAKGNYSVNFGFASGNSFTSGWNSLGIGPGGDYQSPFKDVYLKQLYLGAKPFKGVEIQAGSIGFNRGQATEITTYDNDAYLMGARVTVKRPGDLFFDEISVTSGQLGDLKTPNALRRFDSFGQSNYQQVLVAKNIGKRTVVSGDLTNQWGVSTLRQGVTVKTPELGFLSLVRVEAYQRLEERPDFGYSVYGEKGIGKRLTVGGGYADIDPNYGGLNGDRYNKGRRVFGQAAYKLSDDFTLQLWATQAFGNPYKVANDTRMDVILQYNVLNGLKKLF